MSMYFSRVVLDREHATVAQIAGAGADGYRAHQALWRLFPETPDAKRDFLYRRDDHDGSPGFLVVSARVPQDTRSLWRIETKEYRPRLHAGLRLGFALRANAVQTTRRPEDGAHVRHDIVMNARKRLENQGMPPTEWPSREILQQKVGQEWLEARAARNGFGVEPDSLQVDGYRQHRLYKSADRPMRFSTLDFWGVLAVTSPEIFLQALFHGIGHAKGFGCGLLLVRRI